jgi:anthraniloyl-CoA monooxygenase
MTCVSALARITHSCTGLYTDAQEAAWKRIVDFVHANSAAKFVTARPCGPQGRHEAHVGGITSLWRRAAGR